MPCETSKGRRSERAPTSTDRAPTTEVEIDVGALNRIGFVQYDYEVFIKFSTWEGFFFSNMSI